MHQAEVLRLLPLVPLVIRGLADAAAAGQAALPPLAVHLGHGSEGKIKLINNRDRFRF